MRENAGRRQDWGGQEVAIANSASILPDLLASLSADGVILSAAEIERLRRIDHAGRVATPGADPRDRAARPIPTKLPGPRLLPDRSANQVSGRAGNARTPGLATLSIVPPTTAARPAVGTRRPIHVVVAIGMTAGLYAISLAGVTSLQSATDAQLAADRAPAAGAVAQLKSTHDEMESSLEELSRTYSKAANGYQAITSGIAGHEQALAALGKQVTAAARSAAALSVPTFSRPSAVYSPAATGGSQPAAAISAPDVAAPGVAAPVPALAPLPAVPVSVAVVSSKPVTNACTTASGKPC
jgi:hypothetical protein